MSIPQAAPLPQSIRPLRAPNPSALTGTGTNTYLLGRGRLVLIDPGPLSEVHLRAILAALDPGETLSAILVTHCHLDHTGLAPALSAATGAPIYGFGPAHSGRSALMQSLAAQGFPTGGEGFDPAFAPDHLVRDGARLIFGDIEIDALHTPGHTGCHVCFGWGGHLFSGDHVMGWSTSLISPPDGDMAQYMASLDRLASHGWTHAWPGHGAPITDPAHRIAELKAHRQLREANLLAALAKGPATPADLTVVLYHDTPPQLWPAAERNVLAQLLKLWQEGQITAAPHPAPGATYSLKYPHPG